MKALEYGDVFYGNSHADMINQALGTHYAVYRKSGVELSKFSAPGVIAWFAHMNGSVHGYDDEKDYYWRNWLTSVTPYYPVNYDTSNLQNPGDDIFEEYVGNNPKTILNKVAKEGFYPYRLCFQLDPYNTGDRYCCKFEGAFILTEFKNDSLSLRRFTKIRNFFYHCSYNVVECNISDNKDMFLEADARYTYKIDMLPLPKQTITYLKSRGIKQVSDLLDTGIESDYNSPLASLIREALLYLFGNDAYK